MSAQKSPEDDQIVLNNINKLLLKLVMDVSTTEKQTNLLRKLYNFINNNNKSGPTVKWFDDLTKLLNVLEYTRDSSKSIIQNRETINSEIWLKISKFVENYDEKELNFNTLSLDPSLLFISAPKTPLFRKDIDEESKKKTFSSFPLIPENSVNNLQSSLKQK
ncbi:hypothetical protein Glove_86g114 [Diversispora epigaea]|uniref:Uncharacterized protein n=1 Tax=Diversispora epigaea TaxID=1348612 RepID=A0A397JAV1_9GLOM|nr:hypothetical protein Glove_86g114 [Diversispora epigaea]